MVILSLSSAPQYNGARADVLHFDRNKGRFAIRLIHPDFKGKEMLVLPGALDLIYALLPENLAVAQSRLKGRTKISWEDCSHRWGKGVGRALVANGRFEVGDALFQDAPFLMVSNPSSLERWVRRWDCYWAVTSRARQVSEDVLKAFEDADTGGDDVIETLLADASATLEIIWSAGSMTEEMKQSARRNGMFEREARRIATVLARWQTNQHELGGHSRRALYWLAPKVAHSCGPNVGWEDPDPDTGLVELRALRFIDEGEVLGVNYMQADFLHLSVSARRAKLLKERKFHCVCDRCRSESGECCLQRDANESAVAFGINFGGGAADLEKPRFGTSDVELDTMD